jgi:hypothetical protein
VAGPRKGQGGTGGLALFDVTNPDVPRELSFVPFPFGVHELDMVVRADGRALALLAVPFTEFENVYFGGDLGGEFEIVDVTNPTAPKLVGQFVPPTNSRYAGALGVGPAEVWGVAIDPETGIVYASDMRTGLWIIQPQGPAQP